MLLGFAGARLYVTWGGWDGETRSLNGRCASVGPVARCAVVSLCVCHMVAIQRASWPAARVCEVPYGCQRASQPMPRVYTRCLAVL